MCRSYSIVQFRSTVKGTRTMWTESGEMGSMSKKAVVLLSGGLDSTTVLAYAKSEGFEPYALSFR